MARFLVIVPAIDHISLCLAIVTVSLNRQLLLFFRQTFGYVFYVLSTSTLVQFPLGIVESRLQQVLRLLAPLAFAVTVVGLFVSFAFIVTGFRLVTLIVHVMAWSTGSLSRSFLWDFIDSRQIDAFLSSVTATSRRVSVCASVTLLLLAHGDSLAFVTAVVFYSFFGFVELHYRSDWYTDTFAKNFGKAPGLTEAEGGSKG